MNPSWAWGLWAACGGSPVHHNVRNTNVSGQWKHGTLSWVEHTALGRSQNHLAYVLNRQIKVFTPRERAVDMAVYGFRAERERAERVCVVASL